MERVLEPEVMDGANALAYANATLDEANVRFGEDLLAAFPEIEAGASLRLLDVGSGPGDIGIWLAKRGRGLSITLLDASAEMLRIAERRVAEAGLSERIAICEGYVPEVQLDERSFDFIVSNTFLHHVPVPLEFWTWARRVAKPGAGFFVRDLRRPASPEEVDALVERYAGDAEPLHREDYRNSYHAALTPAEVGIDLRAAGLGALEVAPLLDRYWLVRGRLKNETST